MATKRLQHNKEKTITTSAKTFSKIRCFFCLVARAEKTLCQNQSQPLIIVLIPGVYRFEVTEKFG